MIGSRIGGIPEMFPDTLQHLLVAPGSVDELVTQLGRLEASLDKSLSSICRTHVVNHFSIDHMADGVRRVLTGLGESADPRLER